MAYGVKLNRQEEVLLWHIVKLNGQVLLWHIVKLNWQERVLKRFNCYK